MQRNGSGSQRRFNKKVLTVGDCFKRMRRMGSWGLAWPGSGAAMLNDVRPAGVCRGVRMCAVAPLIALDFLQVQHAP